MSKSIESLHVAPSAAFTTTVGNVTVRTRLYGVVNLARIEREKKIAQYRASQLGETPKRVRPVREDGDYSDMLAKEARESYHARNRR